MKVAFYTLGCKVNQYETQALETLFVQNGFELTDFSEYSDVYIINTCTVTAMSDKKSRNAARRAKQKNPDSILVVCGCYAQVEPDEVKELCGADIVVGSHQKGKIVELVNEALEGKKVQNELAPIKGRVIFEHLPAGGLVGRTRALLKVQDGCQNFCSYCKIPYARGACRSLPLEDAVADAIKIKNKGYKELVITGIEISSYGIDLPDKPSLAPLIKAICLAVPEVRVRLGSLEPRTITKEFVDEIKNLDNLCPHFHLSLQSGCDKTLNAMNRKYLSERYYESVVLLREAFDNCSITTDLIVGFPCETDGDFKESIAFVEKCRLNQVHIFPYSKRKGTKAATMSGQILKAVKTQRAQEAASVCFKLEKEYLENQIGRTVSVLFEQQEGNGFIGHSKEYYNVFVEGENLQNKVCNVLIKKLNKDILIGEIIESTTTSSTGGLK
ncbi:MAG: tRNA (N(6)-L-threonylcarbamoyladenosine(37)-C(2))-methylthiotransferase MtaB [Clostridia bacterium]|nr:tRNA (N(6)-L-threonylcarbamoyladenosine(37)-C(2))-methylthiotransferase MtaB [Clostridia bacterium]